MNWRISLVWFRVMQKGMQKGFQKLWTKRLDVLLLGSSLICFSLIYESSQNPENKSQMGGPMATLSKGEIYRKQNGSRLFNRMTLTSSELGLFNLDTVWVNPKKTAQLTLDDGSLLNLSEKTLLILKKPFKPGHSRLEDKVRLISGTVERHQPFAPLEKMEWGFHQNTSPLKELKSEELKIQENQSIFPPPHSVLYFHFVPHHFRFSWSSPLTGFLVIQNQKDGKKTYTRIDQATFGEGEIQSPLNAMWSVIDDRKKNLIGPFVFEIQTLNALQMKKIWNQKGSSPLYIYW